ncbi:AAA family ATPase [Myxococcota bacterium]|nr:AAA family ATPase [Myxococcota bacterium]MBU1899555.1 AAA family ATPase [Myxococcota bacterium]
MERLIAYTDMQIDELVTDLVASLTEIEPFFRSGDPVQYRQTLHDAIWQFNRYIDSQELSHVDACFSALAKLNVGYTPPFSAIISFAFVLQEQLFGQSQELYDDFEGFLSAMRMYNAFVREALRYLSSVPQGASPWTSNTILASQEIEAQLFDDPAALSRQLGAPRMIGYSQELHQVANLLRTVTKERRHQVVGIKGLDGYGKSTFIQTFFEDTQQHFNRVPSVLHAQIPRLFELPSWSIAGLIRAAFQLPVGAPDVAEHLEGYLRRISDAIADNHPKEAKALREGIAYLIRFVGEDMEIEAPSRAMALATRQALVAFFEGLALETFARTKLPLFLVLEDVAEMEDASWAVLYDLLKMVKPAASLMIFLSYENRCVALEHLQGLTAFFEVEMTPFTQSECGAFIDNLLSPNRLSDLFYHHVFDGSGGSPLLLNETVRQWVEEGIVALKDGYWGEGAPFSQEPVGDLTQIFEARTARLNATSMEILYAISVITDSMSPAVLEGLARRRAIHLDELITALDQLQHLGLVDWAQTPRGPMAVIRHALLRDQVYRSMSPQHRKALHEDAAEVLSVLPGARGFPSLAARHYAFADRNTRALEKFIEALDKALEINHLSGGMALANQTLSQLGNLSVDERAGLRRAFLQRRLCLFQRQGRAEQSARDLVQLEKASSPSHFLSRKKGEWALNNRQFEQARQLFEESLRQVKAAPIANPNMEANITLDLAMSQWYAGQRDAAQRQLNGLGARLDLDALDRPLQGRIKHAQGLFLAARGAMNEALAALFEAWRLHRSSGDIWGAGLTLRTLARHFYGLGRRLDALRLLRHALSHFNEGDEPQTRAALFMEMGGMAADLGAFDEAEGLFNQMRVELTYQPAPYLSLEASLRQGDIFIQRGHFREATGILGQCAHDLARIAPESPAHINAVLARGMHLILLAPNNKLKEGGLSFLNDAIIFAERINYTPTLIRARALRLRAYAILGTVEAAEAERLELEVLFEAACEADPHLERLGHEVGLARYYTFKARGDAAAADAALDMAWEEVQRQVADLHGSGYERGFLNHLYFNREIADARAARGA